jgi:hypothetical protein
MKRRKKVGYTSNASCFSNRIICGECGGFYGSKVWHSTSKYRRVVWQCNQKFKNGEKCRTPHLYEDTIKAAFVDALGSLIENKAEIVGAYRDIIESLTDTTTLNAESVKLRSECEVVLELIRKCVEDNARDVLDQREYQEHYDALAARYDSAKKQLENMEERRADRYARRVQLTRFIDLLNQQDNVITEFDEELWNAAVESVTVNSDNSLSFKFKDGMEVPWRA